MSLAQNKKLHLDFEVMDTFEAGMELTGNEVKSIRGNQVQINSAKVIVRGGEAFLVGLNVQAYQNHEAFKNKKTGEKMMSDRTIKLLLKKSEILKLATDSEKGLSLQAEKIYDKHGLLKLQIALCKRKNKKDKREDLKEKEFRKEKREMGV